jgi:hypothetical protein
MLQKRHFKSVVVESTAQPEGVAKLNGPTLPGQWIHHTHSPRYFLGFLLHGRQTNTKAVGECLASVTVTALGAASTMTRPSTFLNENWPNRPGPAWPPQQKFHQVESDRPNFTRIMSNGEDVLSGLAIRASFNTRSPGPDIDHQVGDFPLSAAASASPAPRIIPYLAALPPR